MIIIELALCDDEASLSIIWQNIWQPWTSVI